MQGLFFACLILYSTKGEKTVSQKHAHPRTEYRRTPAGMGRTQGIRPLGDGHGHQKSAMIKP